MLVIVINYVDVTWRLYETQAQAQAHTHSAKQYRMFATRLQYFILLRLQLDSVAVVHAVSVSCESERVCALCVHCVCCIL